MTLQIIRHLALPATLAHEVAHVAVGSPWAERVAIEWHPRDGLATAHIEWQDGAPDWAQAAAGIAPFVAGLVAAVMAVGVWLRSDIPAPSTAIGWSAWTIIAMWWVVFMTPSGQDLRTATGDAGRTDTAENSD